MAHLHGHDDAEVYFHYMPRYCDNAEEDAFAPEMMGQSSPDGVIWLCIQA
jgi:hypothetical protein